MKVHFLQVTSTYLNNHVNQIGTAYWSQLNGMKWKRIKIPEANEPNNGQVIKSITNYQNVNQWTRRRLSLPSAISISSGTSFWLSCSTMWFIIWSTGLVLDFLFLFRLPNGMLVRLCSEFLSAKTNLTGLLSVRPISATVTRNGHPFWKAWLWYKL